ncbi:MAG: C45 family peptidase [Mediterranea sp.]|jgi:hypothetical protein|nr:C45 family peptidase [Mediterranea sp.]
MRAKSLLIATGILLASHVGTLSACTTIIISGKATPDGRPLMWKNSDTEIPFQSVMYGDQRGIPFLGMVRNSSKRDSTASVWAGTNAYGFAIMNTLSYNLSEKGDGARNGSVMRKALEQCRTVADFRTMLDTLPRPMRLSANYGVVDAQGGAAYFEARGDGYRMVDVNDPAVAPDGYLVYTNFSYTGFYDKGQGYIRYMSAQHEVQSVLPSKGFTPQWIFNHLARCYYHSLLGIDYTSPQALELFANGYIPDGDLIARHSTASATVIQGVRPGENPELTTMWAALGYPPCSVAIPCWVKLGRDNPAIVLRDKETHRAPLSDWVARVKGTVYDVTRGHGIDYVHLSRIYNKVGDGYMQRLRPIEQQVFDMEASAMAAWRADGKLDLKAAKALCHDISLFVGQRLEAISPTTVK